MVVDGVTRITATRIGRTTIHIGHTATAIMALSRIRTMRVTPTPIRITGQGYGHDAATVGQVQRRLGELGYYNGVVDCIMGPRTRAAIAAYESTHNLVVDGTISPRLLARMGLA